MLAFLILVIIYGLTLSFVYLITLIPRRKWKPNGCILVTGTFYNPNWFHSHAQPLAQCGMNQVIFVTDIPHDGVDGVQFVCPPHWVSKILSRALAKHLWIFFTALKHKPDMYIGYHLFPSALSVLMIAKLMNRCACYQMCAGPVEVVGGGIGCENPLLTKLRKPSHLLENLAIKITRYFDLVVVRGKSAQDYLQKNGIAADRIAIIPGSIKLSFVGGAKERENDIVFVGRLVEIKQPMQIMEIIAKVHDKIPELRAVIVGEGPLDQEMREYAETLNIQDSVHMLGKRSDVEDILGKSKIFLLTSRNEGLSIAMAEAMASGVVPVVADVGDLSDLVVCGNNGFVVKPNCIEEYAERIVKILQDSQLWSKLSTTACESARQYNGLDKVSQRWKDWLSRVINDSIAPIASQENVA